MLIKHFSFKERKIKALLVIRIGLIKNYKPCVNKKKQDFFFKSAFWQRKKANCRNYL